MKKLLEIIHDPGIIRREEQFKVSAMKDGFIDSENLPGLLMFVR
jgi:hypothetical protein